MAGSRSIPALSRLLWPRRPGTPSRPIKCDRWYSRERQRFLMRSKQDRSSSDKRGNCRDRAFRVTQNQIRPAAQIPKPIPLAKNERVRPPTYRKMRSNKGRADKHRLGDSRIKRPSLRPHNLAQIKNGWAERNKGLRRNSRPNNDRLSETSSSRLPSELNSSRLSGLNSSRLRSGLNSSRLSELNSSRLSEPSSKQHSELNSSRLPSELNNSKPSEPNS